MRSKTNIHFHLISQGRWELTILRVMYKSKTKTIKGTIQNSLNFSKRIIFKVVKYWPQNIRKLIFGTSENPMVFWLIRRSWSTTKLSTKTFKTSNRQNENAWCRSHKTTIFCKKSIKYKIRLLRGPNCAFNNRVLWSGLEQNRKYKQNWKVQNFTRL